MKKLLSILATVGLIVTTGTTAIACGGQKPKVTPKIAELLKGRLKLGKVGTIDEALFKAQAVIDDIPELKEHVQLSTPADGQIKVTAIDASVSGEAFFTYQLEWTIIQVDISNIKITNIYVGMSFAEYYQIIQTAIDQLILGTQINYDYTIVGSTSHGGKNKITVAVTPDSKLIQGQFKIDILMIEVYDAKITIDTIGMVQRTIENWDQLDKVQVELKMEDEKANAFSKVELIDDQIRFTVSGTTGIREREIFRGIITVTANHVEPVTIAVQVFKYHYDFD